MIIIHHSKDMDGWSSGAICKRKYPEAKLIGWDYGDPIPDFEQFKGEEVIMIDVTFPIDKIKELGRLCDQLTVIDHHASFKKEYDERVDVWDSFLYNYKAGVAACEIGWGYLFPEESIPYAITLIGRYDTWRQKEGDWEGETLPFQYAMRNVCDSPETFPIHLLNTKQDAKVVGLTIIGKEILNYQRGQDKIAAQKYSFEKEVFGGLNALCLNVGVFSSATLDAVYNPEKHDLMIGFQTDGNIWRVSLRSVNDINVSEIAKARGGGGHKNAAGYEVKTYEEIFI